MDSSDIRYARKQNSQAALYAARLSALVRPGGAYAPAIAGLTDCLRRCADALARLEEAAARAEKLPDPIPALAALTEYGSTPREHAAK